MANVTIDLTNTDWPLLCEQKLALLEACGEDEANPLTGLLHFLDNIQDQAALTLGFKVVFGPQVEN